MKDNTKDKIEDLEKRIEELKFDISVLETKFKNANSEDEKSYFKDNIDLFEFHIRQCEKEIEEKNQILIRKWIKDERPNSVNSNSYLLILNDFVYFVLTIHKIKDVFSLTCTLTIENKVTKRSVGVDIPIYMQNPLTFDDCFKTANYSIMTYFLNDLNRLFQ